MTQLLKYPLRSVYFRTNRPSTPFQAFLKHIMASTNMRCLTPPSALKGDCPFLAANLYAKSVFGEDALVNVSVEKCVQAVTAIHRRCESLLKISTISIIFCELDGQTFSYLLITLFSLRL